MNIITLDNLYDFLVKKNESFNFCSNGNENDCIIVHVPEKMVFDEEYDAQSGLLKTHLKSCHLYKNRNTSFISEDSMTQAIPSFYNRPILGYIHQLADGSYDFAGHEMIINKDGELEYQEIPVGVIPESCNAKLVYDKEKDKTYLEVDGLIYEEYTRAADILRAKGECKVSVEIAVLEMSFNAKDRVLNIEKFQFRGVTILGCTADEKEKPIAEGMEGSNIKIEDYSEKPAATYETLEDKLKDPQIMEMLDRFFERLKDEFANFTINNNTDGKEENILVDNKELNFEEEVTTETEIEQEVTTATEEEEVTATEETTAEETPTDVEENNNETENNEEFTEGTTDNGAATEVEVETETDPVVAEMSREEAFQKFFELSHDETRYALNALLSVYRNENEWCYVHTVYDDYLIMEDWDSDKLYKQSYTKEGDVVALSGDRIPMFAMLLTESEKLEIEEMRKNYSSIYEKLSNYEKAELKAVREAVLNAEEYSVLADNAEFAQLKANMENYTPEELSREADLIFAKHVKTAKTFSFAATEEPKKKNKSTFFSSSNNTDNETREPYGGIFKDWKSKKQK